MDTGIHAYWDKYVRRKLPIFGREGIYAPRKIGLRENYYVEIEFFRKLASLELMFCKYKSPNNRSAKRMVSMILKASKDDFIIDKKLKLLWSAHLHLLKDKSF